MILQKTFWYDDLVLNKRILLAVVLFHIFVKTIVGTNFYCFTRFVITKKQCFTLYIFSFSTVLFVQNPIKKCHNPPTSPKSKSLTIMALLTQTIHNLAIPSSPHSSRLICTCFTYHRSDCADLHPYTHSLCQYGIMHKFDSQFRHHHLAVNTESALGPQALLNWTYPNHFRWSV